MHGRSLNRQWNWGFVGYTDTPHNYQVYFLTNRMTVVHKDVKFDEQKAMRVSFERELQLHAVEEILVPNSEEPVIDVGNPHVEDPGVETSTQAKSSRDGRKCTREADRLLHDSRESLGAPTFECRQRRSPERYTGYMALMSGCVLTNPYSFEEVV